MLCNGVYGFLRLAGEFASVRTRSRASGAVGSNGAVGSDGATTRSVALVTILLGAAFSS